MSMKKYIPQIEPWFTSEESRQLSSVMTSTYITENEKTEEMLRIVKAYTRSKYAIAVSNGTVGLVAALLAAEIGPGDDVIVPDLTFIASANAVRLVGANPIFCDVSKTDGSMEKDDIVKVYTENTKAIMPVHLYGHGSDLTWLIKFAEERSIKVIEDAAEAFGVWHKNKHMGTYGDFGVFSLFANKVITAGEGGIILTNSRENLQKIFRIKNHGRDKKGIFIHEHIGYNFCFSDLHAAIAVAQLKRIDAILERKRSVYQYYLDALGESEFYTLWKIDSDIKSNHWFVNIFVEDPDSLQKFLELQGIGTRRFFNPLHTQPCYEEMVKMSEVDYPNSTYLHKHGLSLPSSPKLRKRDLKRVVLSIKEFYSNEDTVPNKF